MSLSDVYRERYYAPGYVYIAGSLSDRAIKIGITTRIDRQQSKLRYLRYGNIGDWVLLYYVWVDGGGRIEHAARRRLRHYQSLRMYKKDGWWQKGREIVLCPFSTALDALMQSISGNEMSGAWQSSRCADYEFYRCDDTPIEATPTVRRAYINPAFLEKVTTLELSIRSASCLKNDNLIYVGDLVQKTEAEMLRTPNFGRKSLNEIKEVLAQVGLHLGMEIPGWTPENVEQLHGWLETPFIRKIDDLEFSIRSANCLKNADVIYIGDLVQKTEAEMLRTPNFGRKSLNEIREALAQVGLHLGMEIVGSKPTVSATFPE
jgi:hypothetical protein